MADQTISAEDLRNQGANFEAYGSELLTLLGSIREKVNTIAENGIKGKAAQDLLDSYETINSTITVFAQKIQDTGSLIISSTNAKADFADDIASAASNKN